MAIHEAAHAVAHIVMGYELEHVSVEESDEANSLGDTKGKILPPSLTKERIQRRGPFSKADRKTIEDDIVNLLSGDIAEALAEGRRYRLDPLNVRTRDERQAMGRVGALWPDYGEADRELERLHDRGERMLRENWAAVEAVAEELVVRGRLTGDETRSLMERLPRGS